MGANHAARTNFRFDEIDTSTAVHRSATVGLRLRAALLQRRDNVGTDGLS